MRKRNNSYLAEKFYISMLTLITRPRRAH